MAVAILAVAALAYWDEQREAAAALEDFAEEQASLASAIAAAVSAKLDMARARGEMHEGDGGDDRELAALFSSLRSIRTRDGVVLLLRVGDPARLLALDGREVDAPEVAHAFTLGDRWARVDRPAAAALGLPERTAMAGLATLDVDGGRPWGVAVIATARRERDRERRAQYRFLLGVGVASGLVLLFGGVALRKQRKQLELERELAVAEVSRSRDEQLVRADKLATMGALATGIAHEVSTPLGVIVGRAEQLEPKVAMDDRGKRAVADIVDQAERISRVVRGFLTLVRGDSPALDRVDPAEIARNAVELVAHRFAKAHVSLAADVAPALPSVACEPRLFEQALTNLLLNACDACEPGGHVELRVRADAERIAFVVTDDGSGLAPDVAARATEPFFTTKATGKGTGLGLAIANEIVKHHHGSLTIEPRGGPSSDDAPPSAPASGRGTRARIEIPTTPRDDA
jgi:signal transduction histidine kinase